MAMAMAVARAAAQARAKTAKIAARAKTMTEHDLDKSERKGLLDVLRDHGSTVYLTTMIADETGAFLQCI